MVKREPGLPNHGASSESPAHSTISRLVGLFNAGRHPELEASARKLVDAHPDSGLAWKALGIALKAQGKDALPALRNAAKHLPTDAEAQRNLGIALADAGRVEEAVASYRRALALKPDYAEALNSLSSALKQLGRTDEAAACVRRALELKPDYAEAHNNLGNALLDLGQFDAAAQSYCRALAIKPSLAEAQLNLGNALKELGRLEDALGHYRRALELKPDYADALNNLGGVLQTLGRTAEAEGCWRNALEIKPDMVAVMISRAGALVDLGKFAEAEQMFQRAMSAEPGNPVARAGIVRCRKMNSDDAAWLEAALLLAGNSLPPRKEAILRFAIGKYYDDVGQFDEAFAEYRRANELSKRFSAKYDGRQVEQAIDAVIRLFSREWVGLTRVDANASSRPVFVIGMPRSGTSLAEQILASHPAVFGAGELDFWQNTLTVQTLSELSGPDADRALCNVAKEYMDLLASYSPDALRVVNKTPMNFLTVGLIRAAFPNASIIHLHRSSIDTCLSIYFQHFQSAHSYANDLEDIVHYYTQYRRMMQHWEATLPDNAILHVPFAGLTQDHETWSRRMVDFIGLPWDKRCLDFHLTERRVGTASNWQVRQKINGKSVERWRNYEKFAGPLLGLAA